MSKVKELKDAFENDFLDDGSYHERCEAHRRLDELLTAVEEDITLRVGRKCPKCGRSCSIDSFEGIKICNYCDYTSYSV